MQQWSQAILSDETWIDYRWILSRYVTYKVGEDNDKTCVVDRYRKNNSIMFLGSFVGVERGLFVI